jgi:cytochrome b involved in lipid metabolism
MSEINLVQVGMTLVGLLVLFVIYNATKGENTKPTSTKSKKTEEKPKKKELPKNGKFTKEEVAKHNTRDDCWIIVDNNVYDVTDYIEEHPGGDSIMTNAGGDSTVGVHGPQHPISMWDVLALYKIGELEK